MSIIAELKRRNVFKVGVAYAIVAWLLIQVASIMFPTFHAPEWVMQVFTSIVLLGLPVALILAWAYELTPGGIKPTAAVQPGESITHETGQKLNYIILGLVIGAVVGVSIFWSFNRGGKEQQTGKEAIHKIEQYVDAGNWEAAYQQAKEIQASDPQNPELRDLWPQFSWLTTIPTEPEGATVFRRAYAADGSKWETLGTSPLNNIRIPFGLSVVRIEKDGYLPLLRTLGGGSAISKELGSGNSTDFNVLVNSYNLQTKAGLPEGKVRVPGWTETIDGKPVELQDFYLDKYEVTNRQYKQFMDAGGYERKEYWEYPFQENGRTLSWQEAMARFTDGSGRPGPATWEAGDYPDGHDDYPVSGISWYEAAAYAKFAGQELPTVYHWRRAVAIGTATFTLPLSNLESDGPEAVGKSGAMNWAGSYDMFGNVREWCYNSTEDKNYLLGGGWNDPAYVALGSDNAQSPFNRSPTNGFRLAITRDRAITAARQPLPLAENIAIDIDSEVPVPDEVFNSYLRMYAYDHTPLNAVIDAAKSTRNWTRQKISFDGVSGKERMSLYLYLPKSGAPPYQTVVFWPGAGVIFFDSIDKSHFVLDFLPKNGRAVAIPVLKGTLERGGQGRAALPPRDSTAFRDLDIQWVKEFLRSVDYLETRPDIDTQGFAYMGASWGGTMGPTVLAMDNRFKTAVLEVAGVLRKDPLMLEGSKEYPEVYPVTFLPRVKAPTLMLNGEFDNVFPVEIAAKPFFRLLGTPAADKQHVIAPGGHFVPRAVLISKTLDWLDRYLGPVH